MSFKEEKTRDRLCAAVEKFNIKGEGVHPSWPKEYGKSFYDDENDALFFSIGGEGAIHHSKILGYAYLIWKDKPIRLDYKDVHYKREEKKFGTNLWIYISDDFKKYEDKIVELVKKAFSDRWLSKPSFKDFAYVFPIVKTDVYQYPEN